MKVKSRKKELYILRICNLLAYPIYRRTECLYRKYEEHNPTSQPAESIPEIHKNKGVLVPCALSIPTIPLLLFPNFYGYVCESS